MRPLQATVFRVGGMVICTRACPVAELWVPRPHRDPFLERILFEPGLLPCSFPRRPLHQVAQNRRRLCSLGTCQTHRLPEIIYWLSSASTKELSGKAGREPQDPHSYGRRRKRDARVLLRLYDPGPKKRGQRSARLAG